ncbi:uncharacterized protein LOC126833011 isoform X1 [Adelges cooleyi]|uniref:uncharacterized protein LOC126833011 isoform X1 n=1 Tax=Adelges cooleyi TaxID=133065 RepID=UPI00218079EC|nr:uncharacterized protein LOC126833011 isoform X1 [Adelges cooleyi]
MLNIEIFLLLGLAAYATCASGNKPNKKGTMRRLICFCCDNSEVNNSKGKCKYTGGGDTTLGVNMDSIDGSDSPDSEPRPIEYYKCIAYKGLSNMDNKGYADGSPNICIYKEGVIINGIKIPMDIGNKNVHPIVKFNEKEGFTVNGRKVPADAKGNPLHPADDNASG